MSVSITRRSAGAFSATWSMFQIYVTFFTPQLYVAAICKLRFQPPGRVRRWRRRFDSNSKSNMVPRMPRGSRNWARPASSFSRAISTKKKSWTLLHSLASREALEAALAETRELVVKGEER